MNYVSHADLCGTAEARAIVQEAESERFHAPWEERALALTLAMGATGLWNIDMSRAARETLPDYAQLSYYQIWYRGLERLIAAHGLLHRPEPSPSPRLQARAVAAVLARGGPTERRAAAPPRFRIGERVRTCDLVPDHHTRLPAYARGKSGQVERVHGVHVFPDSNAVGAGEAPQWLYGVSFEARELWGAGASDATSRIALDAFESYLGPD